DGAARPRARRGRADALAHGRGAWRRLPASAGRSARGRRRVHAADAVEGGMGLFAETAGIFRGRARAVFLSAALALVPAYLVGGGIIFLATAEARARLFGLSRTESMAERTRELPSDAAADQRRDILRSAREPEAPRPTSASLALIAGVLFAALVVTAGLFLAQAAVVPL